MLQTQTLSIERCQHLEAHAKQIMAWRNDPDTLKACFHTKPKTWPEFWDEYRNEYLNIEGIVPLFILQQQQRIALLRFRQIDQTSVDISINIAPEYRGKGFGSEIVTLGIKHLRSNTGVETILAEIKSEHTASKKIFLKSGFCYLKTIDKILPESKNPCQVDQFQFDLTLLP